MDIIRRHIKLNYLILLLAGAAALLLVRHASAAQNFPLEGMAIAALVVLISHGLSRFFDSYTWYAWRFGPPPRVPQAGTGPEVLPRAELPHLLRSALKAAGIGVVGQALFVVIVLLVFGPGGLDASSWQYFAARITCGFHWLGGAIPVLLPQ